MLVLVPLMVDGRFAGGIHSAGICETVGTVGAVDEVREDDLESRRARVVDSRSTTYGVVEKMGCVEARFNGSPCGVI